MRGRLLLRKPKEIHYSKSGEQLLNDEEVTCEQCGTKTKVGTYYSFVYGYQTGVTSEYITGGRLFKTFYRVYESRKFYFCNKCVILRFERKMKKIFKNILIVLFALLGLGILLDISSHKGFSIAPLFIIAFVGAMAFYQQKKLQNMESASLDYYSSIYNNPRYRGKISDGREVKEIIKDQGEKLAIDMKTIKDASIQLTHAESLRRLHPTTKNTPIP